jgi:hypothetical protein
MTRKQAIAIIAESIVSRNGGSLTKAQAVKGLGPWYTTEQLVKLASEIKAKDEQR